MCLHENRPRAQLAEEAGDEQALLVQALERILDLKKLLAGRSTCNMRWSEMGEGVWLNAVIPWDASWCSAACICFAIQNENCVALHPAMKYRRSRNLANLR